MTNKPKREVDYNENAVPYAIAIIAVTSVVLIVMSIISWLLS